MNILVTGGCGFIGSNFIRQRLADAGSPPRRIVNLDMLTYAGNPANLADFAGRSPVRLRARATSATRPWSRASSPSTRSTPSSILQPRSHVDRSIDSPEPFHPDKRRRDPAAPERRAAALGRARRAGKERLPVPPRLDRRGLRHPGAAGSGLHRGDTLTPRTAPTPPPRRRATTWCGPSSTPTGCRPSRPTARTTTGRTISRRS